MKIHLQVQYHLRDIVKNIEFAAGYFILAGPNTKGILMSFICHLTPCFNEKHFFSKLNENPPETKENNTVDRPLLWD